MTREEYKASKQKDKKASKKKSKQVHPLMNQLGQGAIFVIGKELMTQILEFIKNNFFN